MLRVHLNNHYTNDLPEYSKKSYKSILEISKKKVSLKLALVNKQMLACKFIEKGLYGRRFAWNEIFYRNYFHQDLPETYPGLLQNI